MSDALSLPPRENLETLMLKVARDLAMDIYPLPDILTNNGVAMRDFQSWKDHPTFQRFLKSEREAWGAAANTAERTKLKAGIVMEMFMEEAHSELHSKKSPLNQRVELAKVVARLAGFASPTGAAGAPAGPGGFRLQINIGPGIEGYQPQQITIAAQHDNVVDHFEQFEDDGYDPFSSPNTLED